jgi:hypothetical protein
MTQYTVGTVGAGAWARKNAAKDGFSQHRISQIGFLIANPIVRTKYCSGSPKESLGST